MTDLRKAAEMALEALDGIHVGNMTPMAEENWNKALTALRQALAQPEQCICHRCIKENDLREGGFPLSSIRMILCPECGNKRCPKASDHRLNCTGSNESGQEGSVYAAPPSKPWVSLTDDEIVQIVRKRGWGQSYFSLIEIIEFTRDNEAALRRKNT